MVTLSASKIKTLQHCSWLWNAKYILKIPDTTNDGARRGTVTHSILESLINPRHRKHYDKIVKDGTILKHAGVLRLTKKLIKKEGLSEEELPAIDSFTMVALKLDFFLEGYNLEDPEFKFEIENEKPRYKILGFIDKMGIKGEVAKIVDYKTSKSKPDAKEQNFNIQGMMYMLVAKKTWPKVKKAFVNFLYLKFKQSPKLVFTCSDEKLAGFELYLEYLNDYLENWDLGKAMSNFGYDDYNKRRLCGKKETAPRCGDAP
jgi:ATP-dependent helicase/DNAse subunit B